MDIFAETLPKTFSTVKMDNVQDVETGKISTSNKTYESESEATIFKKEVPVAKRKLSDFLILSVKTIEAQLEKQSDASDRLEKMDQELKEVKRSVSNLEKFSTLFDFIGKKQ